MTAANQQSQQPIKGYRQLTQQEIDLVNEGKALGEQVEAFISKVMTNSDSPDTMRWASIARTNLQQGFMALTRAVTRPTNF